MLGDRFMASQKAAKAQAPHGSHRRNEGLSDGGDDPARYGRALKKLKTIKPEDHHHGEGLGLHAGDREVGLNRRKRRRQAFMDGTG
jgi:hypothetical protein